MKSEAKKNSQCFFKQIKNGKMVTSANYKIKLFHPLEMEPSSSF